MDCITQSYTPEKVISGEGGQKILALRHSQVGDGHKTLKKFASRIGGKHVLDLHTPKNATIQDEILHAMRGANQIHFNAESLGSLKSVLHTGRTEKIGSKNFRYTSWEFAQIIDNPSSLKKTTIHLPDGRTISGANVLRLVE